MANTKFLSFKRFIESIETAKPKANRFSETRAKSEFENMRKHLLDHYHGIDVVHSYMDDHGQIWDCISVHDQPALKRTGAKLATPPDVIPFKISSGTEPTGHMAGENKNDKYGNKQSCPDGTFAKRRLTMEELARFETLQDFFKKAPGIGKNYRRLEGAEADLNDNGHLYAFGRQVVTNYGAHAVLNVWAPAVQDSEGMSVSQLWVMGGSGAGLQTVECGWHVYPKKYGDYLPHLFLFWTPDDYKHCRYNGEDNYFTFNNNSPYLLGGALTPSSEYDGPQYEYSFFWVMHEGNWWLYINSFDQAHAIGYFAGSVFGGGQMSRFAEQIDFGGETYSVTSSPQMGSGYFAQNGIDRAAYQNNISYISGAKVATIANLSFTESDRALYTIEPSQNSATGASFFFGGPGNFVAQAIT